MSLSWQKEKYNSTYYYYWWLSTKFWSIYQLQQRVLRPFTVIFHARVWANLYSSKLYCEKIQLTTTVLQYIQPDLSFSLTLALPLACWTSPTSTSWVSNVFKSDRSSRSCYDPDYGKSAKDGGQGRPILPGLLLSFVLLIQTRLSQIMPDIYWL